jgi:dynein heavy chain
LQPPPGMLLVIEALAIILNKKAVKAIKKEDFWMEAKSMFNETQFVQKLLEFNKDAIKDETILKLKPYITDPTFTPAAVEKISVACRSLCEWIRAIENYYWVRTPVTTS